jgi:hypothetical protein
LLSRRWRRRAGAGGEGPNNQLKGRGEGDTLAAHQGGYGILGRSGSASGGVVGGWTVMGRMTRSRAAAFGGMLRCIGRCCRGRGGHARQGRGSGERRWCDGPHGGRGPQRLGAMQWCNGRCCRGRGGGAMDKRGGCIGVFVFYLHMGMGKIHWREEGDPIIIL